MKMYCIVCGQQFDTERDGGQKITIDNDEHYVCRKDWPGFNTGAALQRKMMEAMGDIPKQDTPEKKSKREEATRKLHEFDLNPRQIVEALDEYVIGQERAKREVAVAVYDHHKIHQGLAKPDQNDSKVDLEKSNVILIGPSGSGKTLIARTLARSLGVPFSSADVTSLSPTGYVGNDVESVLTPLYIDSGEDVELAARGIVFLDEIDKIARKSMANPSISRDVSGEAVQHALLKMVEGTKAQLPLGSTGRKHPDAPPELIDTTNILFIGGGAFEGFPEVVAKKMHRPTSRMMGLRASKDDIVGDPQKDYEILAEAPPDVMVESLIEYGFVPELAGRLPVVVPLAPLTKEQMRQALTEPKNAVIKQQIELFRRDDIELIIPDDTLDAIVDKAVSMKTGVRALRSLTKQITSRARYEHSGDKSVHRILIPPKCLEDPSVYEAR